MKNSFKVPFLSICSSFMWGFNFPAIKLITTQMPPLFTVGFRFLIMGMMLFPILLLNARPKIKEFGLLFILSLLIYAIPMGLQGLALQWVDASIVSLSTQLEPVVMIILGVIFFKEKIFFSQVIGLFSAVFGVYLVLDSPEIDLNDVRPTVYLGVAILSWAGGMVSTRAIKLGGLVITGYSMLFASVPVLLFSFYTEAGQLSSFMAMPEKYYILYGVMSIFSICANFFYAYLIKISDVNKVAPYLLLIPIFSLVAGYQFLGETLEFEAMFGAIFILIGVLLASGRLKIFNILNKKNSLR